MASYSSKRIRLVKCPKCLKILQEDEDVPVYQCGGCSTILQAKRRNIASKSVQETEEEAQGGELVTNNVSCSLGKDIVLPTSSGQSSDQEYEKIRRNVSMEYIEKELGALDLDETNEIQQQIEAEGNSKLAARESDLSGNDETSPDVSSTVEKKKSRIDESESSSSDEMEREDRVRSGEFEMPRYFGNYKEQGASSSSTFYDKRRNGITAYSEWYKNRSQQLEGLGGRRIGRQGKRHVTEQRRPDLPLYPREPYRQHISPSYQSHDEFYQYPRTHSLQMPPPYSRVTNQEFVNRMFHNNTKARETAGNRRNRLGYYSSQLHNYSYSSYSVSPHRRIEQPRWSREIVSDAEDHHHHQQRNRHSQPRRQRIAKRHIRATAGGAPFVNCYICYQNLQLPIDFLIFNKNHHHLLRCGTCNTVLRFSLESRTRLVPAVVVVTHNTNANSNSTPKHEKATRGSPLHRLMGYSTVSQVFKASSHRPSSPSL